MQINRNRAARKQFGEIVGVLLAVTGHAWIGNLISVFIKFEVLAIIITSIFVIAWPAAVASAWQNILSAADSDLGLVILVAIFIVLGFLLYLARVYLQPIYGLAEIAVGVAAGVAAFRLPAENALVATLAVIGGIYLLVQGFDNLFELVGQRHLPDTTHATEPPHA